MLGRTDQWYETENLLRTSSSVTTKHVVLCTLSKNHWTWNQESQTLVLGQSLPFVTSSESTSLDLE